MSEPFLGEIKLVAFDYAPRGYANCDGALLPISTNSSLYALIGTTYGGNGTTVFGLPDLRGRVPIHTGQASGRTNRILGSAGGLETVQLNANHLPSHTHSVSSAYLPTTDAVGNQTSPDGNHLAKANDGESNYSSADATGQMPLAGNTSSVGDNTAHENMPPFLTLRFVIALTGIFPLRD